MSSLQSKISSLVSDFASKVINAVRESSIHEVAGISAGATPAPIHRPVQQRPAAPKPAAKPAVKPAAAKPAIKKAPVAAKPNGKAAGQPSRVRRTKEEMESTRMTILSTLAGSEEPMKSSDNAAAIGQTEPQALTFPLRTLVKEALISQKGVRGQAKYVIRTAGKDKIGATAEAEA